jgi:hypothetical protein
LIPSWIIYPAKIQKLLQHGASGAIDGQGREIVFDAGTSVSGGVVVNHEGTPAAGGWIDRHP